MSAIKLARQKPLTTLSGPAGTGKTTIAKHIAAEFSNPIFVAPTAKAAQVLSSKGAPASTIHSLIYKPTSKSRQELNQLKQHYLRAKTDKEQQAIQIQINKLQKELAQPSFILNDRLPTPADLIIVDESSMVGARLLSDLLSFKVPILALGDPYQLPPVSDRSPLPSKPDIMLTQLHRFAENSPINHFATLARQSKPLGSLRANSGIVRYDPHGPFPVNKLSNFDQVICGVNARRHTLNKQIRQLLKRTTEPSLGDKLIGLRNEKNYPIVNGEQYTVQDLIGMDIPFNIATDQEQEAEYKLDRSTPVFAYAYAITCHKAQGSQWPTVAIFDDSHVFRKDASRWLYTAITRASARVVILRPRIR